MREAEIAQMASPETTLHDAGKLLLRILLCRLMLFHGADKVLHGIGGVSEDLTSAGLPAVLAYGVFLGEVVAPLFILAGVWTRPWALLYAGTILFASLLVHGADYLRLAPTGAWAAEVFVFYVVTAVAVALLGPGGYSVRRGRSRWDSIDWLACFLL